MNSEVIDIMAREEIRHIKEEQYAQTELIKSTRELAQSAVDIARTSNEVRYADLERRMGVCDSKHEAASQHRRRSDKEMSIIEATLKESLKVSQENQATFKENQETLKELLKFAQQYGKTVERARDEHTFKDKLKESLIYVAVISAGLFGLREIFHFFT